MCTELCKENIITSLHRCRNASKDNSSQSERMHTLLLVLNLCFTMHVHVYPSALARLSLASKCTYYLLCLQISYTKQQAITD